MGFPKKLLGHDETVVLLLRPHVKRLFGPAVLLLVVAPAAAFVAGLVPEGSFRLPVRWAVAAVAVLVVLRWTVWPFLRWWTTTYVVTNRRLVMRSGILTRSGHDMPLTRLNDVSFEHNLFERMLGCGTLVVESAGERGQVTLADVPHVEEVQRTLYRLADELTHGPGRWAPPADHDASGDGFEHGSDDPGRPVDLRRAEAWEGSGGDGDAHDEGDGAWDGDGPDDGPRRGFRWGRPR